MSAPTWASAATRFVTSDTPWFAATNIKKVGEGFGFAHPQGFQYIDYSDLPKGTEPLKNRHIIRKATLEDFIKNPNFAHEDIESPGPEMTLYTNYQYTELKWGMTIDMNSCVGCKTCIVACQAENNIPVVGKEQTMRGRQMQWLRVDMYYEGGTENPTMYYQPVPCQQCENAPCEVVCPVGATVHSTEGLNDMVYNRCVGTRYCSNNCPYKVRRFNFLLFQDFTTPQYKMMRNPEVSVRSRGVMETAQLRILELPVDYGLREGGVSKVAGSLRHAAREHAHHRDFPSRLARDRETARQRRRSRRLS